MKDNPKKAKSSASKKKSSNKIIIVLSCIAAALILLIAFLLINLPKNEEPDETVPTVPTVMTTVSTEPVTTAPTEIVTEPVETEPPMLEDMAALYQENPDVVGWIKVEDTKIDYPVMFTPDDEERYMRANFKGHLDLSGLPFIDKDCSMEPESDNIIMYGHNMKDGSGFGGLMKFSNKKFWENHRTISFKTLYEDRTYEVVAAFYDRVYYKSETDVFKFYQFIDYESEEEFNNAMAEYEKKALYKTGVTPEYGDRFISLVTCAYHVKNGRFVVIAREIPSANELASEVN